ncbi:MAG: nucleotide sugar dehydrogenase [Candidatus Omnitrophota bacterium]
MKNPIAAKLGAKIRSSHASLSVIGLGYVGLPLAIEFARKGFRVQGIDRNLARLEALRDGISYVDGLAPALVRSAMRSKKFDVTDRYDVMAASDVVIICVPTPLNRVGDPDISFIVDASEGIRKRMHPGMLVVLESTTYPGTTDEVIQPILEKSGLKVGKDFFLCFSPERIDPGNPKYHVGNIPKVVGGITPVCADLGVALYKKMTSSAIRVSSSRTAEMTKLLENTFRIVNIGLVNELAQAAEGLNVDIWEAIDAAKSKPFGYMPFYPGPGIGGHCIGIDPIYLSWKARLQGDHLHFIELARRVNAGMPHYVVSKSVLALNTFRKKAVAKSRVLILGVSYKKNISDQRESPALDMLQEFQKLGAQVSYHDPLVPSLQLPSGTMRSVPLTETTLKRQDLVLVATDHDSVDYGKIVKHAPLVFDSRNRLRRFVSEKIVRL